MGRHRQSGGDRLGCFDGLHLNEAHGGSLVQLQEPTREG